MSLPDLHVQRMQNLRLSQAERPAALRKQIAELKAVKPATDEIRNEIRYAEAELAAFAGAGYQ